MPGNVAYPRDSIDAGCKPLKAIGNVSNMLTCCKLLAAYEEVKIGLKGVEGYVKNAAWNSGVSGPNESLSISLSRVTGTRRLIQPHHPT